MLLALLLAGQSTEAQYLRAKQGDVVPYKEAVITNLPTYRAETVQMKRAEKLITKQRQYIDSLHSELQGTRLIATAERRRAEIGTGMYTEANAAFIDLSKDHQELLKKSRRQNRIWNRREFWFVMGFLGARVFLSQ